MRESEQQQSFGIAEPGTGQLSWAGSANTVIYWNLSVGYPCFYKSIYIYIYFGAANHGAQPRSAKAADIGMCVCIYIYIRLLCFAVTRNFATGYTNNQNVTAWSCKKYTRKMQTHIYNKIQ